MTEDEEVWLLEKFKELYTAFPEGFIKKTESPDFIIENTLQKVGIELTEAFQDSTRGSSFLQRKSSDQDYFVRLLIKNIQPEVPFTFSIGISFNYFNSIKGSERKKICDFVSPLCISILKSLANKESVSIKDHTILPKEIDRIHFSRYDGLKESFITQIEGGSVSNFTDEHLKSILLKKHERLQKYQTCDEYWLLIREGNYYAGSFDEIRLKHPVISAFSKVFVLRTKKSELVQLK